VAEAEEEEPISVIIGDDHSDAISTSLPLPDGRLLVGSHDGSLRILDVGTFWRRLGGGTWLQL